MTDDVAAAAEELAPEYGEQLRSELEDVLYRRDRGRSPGQFTDPFSIAGAIASIAQLAVTVYYDPRDRHEKRTEESVAAEIASRHSETGRLTKSERRIIQVVVAKVFMLTAIRERGEHREGPAPHS